MYRLGGLAGSSGPAPSVGRTVRPRSEHSDMPMCGRYEWRAFERRLVLSEPGSAEAIVAKPPTAMRTTRRAWLGHGAVESPAHGRVRLSRGPRWSSSSLGQIVPMIACFLYRPFSLDE
jgi:hypothetical protein